MRYPTWHLDFGTMFGLLKQGRRRRLRAQPFPKEWLATIQRSALFFRRLSASDQAELLGHIQVFLAEKRFEGCGGLAITDEIRVTIAAQGVPGLTTRGQQLSWSEVMRTEFASLRAADETGIPTLLDTYGATNPAEFFAVSTEAFFERPFALRSRHPKLYAELQRYFRQDPVEYSAEHKHCR